MSTSLDIFEDAVLQSGTPADEKEQEDEQEEEEAQESSEQEG